MTTLAFPDLFDSPALPGFVYRDGFVTPAEEAELIALIDQQPLAPFRFQGWLGKRLTLSFGWHYDFDHGAFGATTPLPDWLLPIKRRAARFTGLPMPISSSAGIGWHRDRPVFEHVVGLSLGVPATLRFRRRRETGFERVAVDLAPRSLYHLSGAARHVWEHSIAEMAQTRWSITFRSFSAAGLKTIG